MLDSKGVIRKDAENLSLSKIEFATDRKIDTLEEAMKDADVFIGLSIADIVTPGNAKIHGQGSHCFCDGQSRSGN